jgi:hypothetical protein
VCIGVVRPRCYGNAFLLRVRIAVKTNPSNSRIV